MINPIQHNQHRKIFYTFERSIALIQINIYTITGVASNWNLKLGHRSRFSGNTPGPWLQLFPWLCSTPDIQGRALSLAGRVIPALGPSTHEDQGYPEWRIPANRLHRLIRMASGN